jgi:hypothetical protein
MAADLRKEGSALSAHPRIRAICEIGKETPESSPSGPTKSRLMSLWIYPRTSRQTITIDSNSESMTPDTELLSPNPKS